MNDHEEPLGSAADEAAKLLGALGDWAREHSGAGWGEAAAAWAHELDGHLATGAPECTWCPVCRAVRVLRTASPEVRDHLAAAITSLARAATEMLGTAPEERGGVERIDLSDESGDWPGESDR